MRIQIDESKSGIFSVTMSIDIFSVTMSIDMVPTAIDLKFTTQLYTIIM